MVELAIIIVNYNTKQLLLNCIKDLLSSNFSYSFEIWVVDNNSTDGSVNAIKNKYPSVRILENKTNLGFSAGNNMALRKAKAENYLLLNSDTRIISNNINNLVNFANLSEFGIIAPKLLNPNQSFQPNVGKLPLICPLMLTLSGLDDLFNKFFPLPSYQTKNINCYKNNMQVGWVSGACMLIKKTTIDKVGFLDEKIFMYGEDVDYCWRANKKNIKVGWTDTSEIIHFGGKSSNIPKYNQWLGEFRGLIYLYKKNFSDLWAILLKIIIYFFIILRIIAFTIIGRKEYALTYAKILTSL